MKNVTGEKYMTYMDDANADIKRDQTDDHEAYDDVIMMCIML